MNFIVLMKQVPDIKSIPEEAWDRETGTLRRSLLDNVCNELDKQALALALELRKIYGGIIVVLTMGPVFADEVLRYALAAGADEGVLLTDRKLGGADTAATAYPLSQAIRKIERDVFIYDRQYLIISGMQSVDGDTAQVPPQVAEDLGIPHIAYVTSFRYDNGNLLVNRITRRGMQTVKPKVFPCMLTVTGWTLPPNVTFSRTRWAYNKKLIQYNASDIDADSTRIGLAGSRTTVFRIFSPKEVSRRKCVFETDLRKLAKMIKEAFDQKLAVVQNEAVQQAYRLPDGKSPSYKGEVWVFAEQEGGELNTASLEVLGKARSLADQLQEKVGAVLVGRNVRNLAKDLIVWGADKVYCIDHEIFGNFLPVPYSRAISELIDMYKPQIMLYSATPMGRELAPRVAYHTGSGLTADCTGLDIFDYQKGKEELVAILRQTRPALGGNIMASIISQNSRVQMSTVRPGVMKTVNPDYERKGDIIDFSPDPTGLDPGVEIIVTEERAQTSELKNAAIVVAGGGGCRTREGFNQCIPILAESLERYLGQPAMVGASRVAVEAGFIDRSHQIGQTGQTVKPRLYIAAGISGAVQHLTGMQNSDIIVAINKDPNARIFKAADFGIVGNIEEVIPRFIEALHQVQNEKDLTSGKL